MQNGPTSAAVAWARVGWRRIALIAATLVLAVALIASLGSPSTSVSADADSEDATELVAAYSVWNSDGDRPTDLYPIRYMMVSRGPSWT